MSDLGALKQVEVRLAVDDFGTGFSPLAWRRRFPIDRLKIDGSFVSGVGRDGQDTSIVESCITLAPPAPAEASRRLTPSPG